MMDELDLRGVPARMVVVGDDDNLATAERLGFDTLERPNVLGRKVNDGFEYACQRGADFVSFIGSDDWAHADWYSTMPPAGVVKTSRWAAVVAPGGTRLLVRTVASAVGAAPWIIPRDLLARAGFRPCANDNAMSGIDGSIHAGLSLVREPAYEVPARRRAQARAWDMRVVWDDSDPLRFVDFKGSDEQITPFSQVVGRARFIERDEPDPWPILATRYPADLVAGMREHYASGGAG